MPPNNFKYFLKIQKRKRQRYKSHETQLSLVRLNEDCFNSSIRSIVRSDPDSEKFSKPRSLIPSRPQHQPPPQLTGGECKEAQDHDHKPQQRDEGNDVDMQQHFIDPSLDKSSCTTTCAMAGFLVQIECGYGSYQQGLKT